MVKDTDQHPAGYSQQESFDRDKYERDLEERMRRREIERNREAHAKVIKLKGIIYGVLLLALIALLVAINANGAVVSDQIFDSRFRTLKTSVADEFMAALVIRLGTNDRIIVNFDEIGEDNSFLQYRLIHCNADWEPSRLVESEYLDGFNVNDVRDFAFSSGTFVHFINYQIEIPNDDVRIKYSGNYLLQVFHQDDPDRVVLQTRFMVSENTAVVEGAALSRTDRGHYSEWQQLELTVDGDASGISNPYSDILVRVDQNGREETARWLRNPTRVEGVRMTYKHQPDLIFPASNEYRRFESVSNGFPGMHVDSLRYMGSNYHVWLKKDEPRAYREYEYDRTQHGRFLVREYNSTDSDLGADYITVHFLLETDRIPDADVYVDGEFTHGLYTDANRMTYDPEAGAYRAEIPVKQGAYNYQYVVRDARNPQPSPAPIEGNKYETDNEYRVAVYFRPPGSRGDRLIGFRLLGNR